MTIPTLVSTDLPDSHRDVLEAAGVATLATLGPDGRPQLTAVWYLLDDDGQLKVSVRADRQKVHNLARRSAATLLVVDPCVPTRTVEVRATAEMTPDDDYTFAGRLGAKYGADIRSFDQPEHSRVVVTLRPDRVNYRG